MNTKNNKVSFILIYDLNHAVKDNEPDEHFQFVQNLAKNFDKSRFIKTDYKRSSSGVDVSTSSCCSNSSCISLNNRCVEVSNEFKLRVLYGVLRTIENFREKSGSGEAHTDIRESSRFFEKPHIKHRFKCSCRLH